MHFSAANCIGNTLLAVNHLTRATLPRENDKRTENYVLESLLKRNSTLYRSPRLLSFVFVKLIRSAIDPTYSSKIIVYGCCLDITRQNAEIRTFSWQDVHPFTQTNPQSPEKNFLGFVFSLGERFVKVKRREERFSLSLLRNLVS